MPIHRTSPSQVSHVFISKDVIRSNELSAQAVGVFCILQTLANDELFDIHEICESKGNTKEEVDKAVEELIKSGLVSISPDRVWKIKDGY